MPTQRRPRRRRRKVEKRKPPKRTNIRRSRDTPQVRVNLRLFSPSKAQKLDPRRAVPQPSPNYNLIMATESDMDPDVREDILRDRHLDICSDSECSSCDIEEEIPDWERYVDFHADFGWLELVEGEVVFQRSQNSKPEMVGYCRAYLIRRIWIADSFWNDMEEPEHEMAELAFELYDRFGCLQPQFKHHPIKRGSGAWNEELDNGDILLIEQIRISPDHRRKAMGTRLVRAILDLASNKSDEFFAITWPGVLEREVGAEMGRLSTNDTQPIRNHLADTALEFFRKLGFRRIGSSRWLGYSPDTSHPSHAIAPEDDFDLPHILEASFTPEMDSLKNELPTINDTECLTRLRRIFHDIPPGDMRWAAKDKRGNTLLHLVPCSSKIESTTWLIRKNPELRHMSNADGSTPLEVLEASMEQKRTIHEVGFKRADISDRFTGFDNDSLSCLALLRGLVLEQLSDAEISRLRFGCTCGGCLGGFLSPRVLDILLVNAETTFDFIHTYGDRMDGERWCKENEDVFKYTPGPIQQRFLTNKGMRTGFSMLWKYLSSCLGANMLPTEENILSLIRNSAEWPPHCRNFIQQGGAVSSAATMLFQRSMDMEEYYEIVHGERETVSPLPRCRNDREFGLVSGMCGYERVPRVQIVTMRGKRIRY